MLKQIRIWLWVAVAIVAVVAIGGYYMIRGNPAAGTEAAGGFGGGTYALVDQDDKPVDQTMFDGHPSLLFFGFTHCADVCPTTMAEMAGWFEQLGERGKNLEGYFVSIDPDRDTPAVLHDYVRAVSDRITGITGPQAEIDKMVKAWHVYAAKVPGENGDYDMDHTASVFLLDSKGQFVGTVAYGEDAKTALDKVHRLLDKA